jgi:hypothetical protein
MGSVGLAEKRSFAGHVFAPSVSGLRAPLCYIERESAIGPGICCQAIYSRDSPFDGRFFMSEGIGMEGGHRRQIRGQGLSESTTVFDSTSMTAVRNSLSAGRRKLDASEPITAQTERPKSIAD